MFNKKAKPLILGHRGQPRLFQENTIEGIKSLADLGADGFETDIYLTDHGQLVLFHDDNAKVIPEMKQDPQLTLFGFSLIRKRSL